MTPFEYLIALVSIIAGLGLTRALSGIADVAHADKNDLSSVHIAWTISILLWLVTFWWFTYLLNPVETWTLPLLIFILLYGSVIYFLIALLYPNELAGKVDHFGYFLEKRRWFFGTFIALAFLDIVDTWLKFQLMSTLPPMKGYVALMTSWLVLGSYGFYSDNRIFHKVFAYCWVVIMGFWVTTALETI